MAEEGPHVGRIEIVGTLEPQTREYYRLKFALAEYRDLEAKGGWPTVPKGPALKPGMNDKRVPILRKRLQATGDLALGVKATLIAAPVGLVCLLVAMRAMAALPD